MRPEPTIAVMDSGVGGLPYLESARSMLPSARFVYLADREGFPYGTKTREEVEAIVRDRVRRLVRSFDPAAVVIACNTASQAALAAVRADNPGLPVIGTVPAVKPAAERSRSGVIGVLATDRSVQDPYLDELESRFASGRVVVRRGAQDLVAFVERRLFAADRDETRAVLRPHLEYLVEKGVDEIVLACTHFLHVAAEIESLAGELARARGGAPPRVVDSREGVARRLHDLMSRDHRDVRGAGSDSAAGRPQNQRREDDSLFLSGPPPFEAVYAQFASRFGLSGPFALDDGIS